MSETLAKIGIEMVEEMNNAPATNVTPFTWCRSRAMVGRTVAKPTRPSIAPIRMARKMGVGQNSVGSFLVMYSLRVIDCDIILRAQNGAACLTPAVK